MGQNMTKSVKKRPEGAKSRSRAEKSRKKKRKGLDKGERFGYNNGADASETTGIRYRKDRYGEVLKRPKRRPC